MITRMEIIYRSQAPCSVKPAIFTTGGYAVTVGDRELHFDFEDMEANTEIEDGYLHINAVQKNFDESLLGGFTMAEADTTLRTATREDYTEIFYECFADESEGTPILLEPTSVVFFDYSVECDGQPIIVGGFSEEDI